jgi:cation transport ATPase
MKKNFKLEGLDCANCAAKMEKQINELPMVTAASVNFFAMKLVMESEDMETALAEAKKIAAKFKTTIQ